MGEEIGVKQPQTKGCQGLQKAVGSQEEVRTFSFLEPLEGVVI